MLRLYMDEDSMDQVLLRALWARGIDAMTVQQAGMAGRPDPDQLAFAAKEGRTLCTFNVRDFWRLHGEYLVDGRQHAGIILVPQQRYDVGELLRRLLHLIVAISADDMVNRAEFLSAWEPQE